MDYIAGALAHLLITILRLSTPGVPIVEPCSHLLHQGCHTAGQCADLARALPKIFLCTLTRGGLKHVNFFAHAG
jgi:hypothetical protein